MTPESKVKKKVSKYLDTLPKCWYNMPVPSGYGRPMLDYIGCLDGRAFAIETKAPGAKLSPRQEGMVEDMARSGMVVFVIDDTPKHPLETFMAWAELLR